MERHQIIEMMRELKLAGMRAAFDEILVGYAESWAQAGTPPPVPPPATGKATTKKKTKAKTPASKTGQPQNLGPAFHIPFGLQPQLTAGGYVFPVYGPHNFVDTFGAFRGDVPIDWNEQRAQFGGCQNAL